MSMCYNRGPKIATPEACVANGSVFLRGSEGGCTHGVDRVQVFGQSLHDWVVSSRLTKKIGLSSGGC